MCSSVLLVCKSDMPESTAVTTGRVKDHVAAG